MKIVNDNHIREALLRDFPDLATDEECLSDTLSGLSDFDEQAAAVYDEIAKSEALIDGAKERQRLLSERITRLEGRANRLRRLLLQAMEDTGRRKLSLPEATISVSTAQRSVIITDDALIPPSYTVTPPAPPPRPDKAAIKKALTAGQDVPGATLSNTATTLTIRRG